MNKDYIWIGVLLIVGIVLNVLFHNNIYWKLYFLITNPIAILGGIL